ncbi:MAG: hypothetical protein GX957_01490 [Clostridiaceae bacterium]|nr:hypothetical protein [Clostridiaceae bacterium]
MKVLMKSVDMICLSNSEGIITPIKFRFRKEGHEPRVIRIDRIIDKKEEKIAGNRMLVFTLQTTIDGIERIFEMKYEIQTFKWYLYKI